MAKKSVSGQDSNAMGEHNDLVSYTVGQKDPYRAKASEFTVASGGTDGTGQDSDASSEHNELTKQSKLQLGPRLAEEGPQRGDRDSMAERAAGVAANFKVMRNKGEGGSPSMNVAIPESVDMCCGCVNSSGYSQTKVKEVPAKMASIGE